MVISLVTVLGDGSEREVFRRFPREEPHLHERWELSIPRGAPFTVETSGGRCWIGSDAAALVAAGRVHRLVPSRDEAGGLERLYIAPPTARVLIPDRWREAAGSTVGVIDGAVARDWSAVLRSAPFEAAVRASAPAVQPEHHRLARAVRYLEDHLDRTVPLDELSKACGLSKFHLCRMFHRVVGVTPRTYHRHIRVERGRAMLHAGTAAADIARALSFSDQSHFIRSFRKQFGVTPGDFVQARRAPGSVAA